jgi:hypothetical protein
LNVLEPDGKVKVVVQPEIVEKGNDPNAFGVVVDDGDGCDREENAEEENVEADLN